MLPQISDAFQHYIWNPTLEPLALIIWVVTEQQQFPLHTPQNETSLPEGLACLQWE